MKKIITEEQLKNVIFECVKETLQEYYEKRQIPGLNSFYRMKWDYRFCFGKYQSKSVKEIFESGFVGKEYLIWAYYNNEYLDFIPEIVEALGIEPIEKPGKNTELGDIQKQAYINSLSDEERQQFDHYWLKSWRTNKNYNDKRNDAIYARGKNRDDKLSNPGSLQWKNQGH